MWISVFSSILGLLALVLVMLLVFSTSMIIGLAYQISIEASQTKLQSISPRKSTNQSHHTFALACCSRVCCCVWISASLRIALSRAEATSSCCRSLASSLSCLRRFNSRSFSSSSRSKQLRPIMSNHPIQFTNTHSTQYRTQTLKSHTIEHTVSELLALLSTLGFPFLMHLLRFLFGVIGFAACGVAQQVACTLEFHELFS